MRSDMLASFLSNLKIRGIRRRWLLSSVGVLVLILTVLAVAFILIAFYLVSFFRDAKYFSRIDPPKTEQ